MKLLIDANIILEMLLEKTEAIAAPRLLANSETYKFFVTDFAVHSIGLLLFQKNCHQVFQDFTEDMLLSGYLNGAGLTIDDLKNVCNASQKYNLDFDDASRYVLAAKYNLTLGSFDSDFDRTTRGRKTPAELIQPESR